MYLNQSTAAVVAFLAMGVQSAAAQDLATSIVGTWKLADITRKDLATGTTVKTLGEKPVGHIVYTSGGRAVWFFTADNRKAPAGPNPTDAERSALFNTMAGCSETYRVEGDKITGRCDASWNQSWTGIERTSTAGIVGKTLTLTSTPFKSSIDGKEVVVTTSWERVE